VSILLTSSAFADGEFIPARYTCAGEDVSPPLQWSNVPAEAKSLAIVCDDPDAPSGTWVHWVIYDIPPAFGGLTEAVPAMQVTPDGVKQGKNDFRRIGYGGPCPPPGSPHHYHFKIYALDVEPGFPVGATKADLAQAMKGHVLAEGRLVGLFQR
jgi:Raf kinase inhibitor-like YbhB/YbcL family protein